MRHHNANRKLSRETDQRRALLRSLARSLVIREKIKTTEAKAKELRPYVEKLITRGKTVSLANHRYLIGIIGPEAAKKVSATLSPKFKDRTGGYVRIIRLPRRISDGSLMAHVEFV